MAWVDTNLVLGSFLDDFEDLITDHGWSLEGKVTLTGSNSTKGYVRLYSSVGTDEAERKFGVAYKYNPQSDDIDAPIHFYVFSYEGVTPPEEASGTDWGTIDVSPTSITSGEALFDALYTQIDFTFPSPPTVVSILSQESVDRMWYPESEVYCWGNIDEDKIALFFRLDPTPDWTKAYYAPLYIGAIEPLDGDTTTGKHIIIGGGHTDKEIQPRTVANGITDYGPNTGNGNSYVMLQKAKGGARCQRHYLAFITHDVDADSPEGRFNPSRYSGKYHLSYVYVVHPENGFVGKLKDCLAVHPKSIMQMSELEVEVDPEAVPPVTELYRYTLPTTPLTPFLRSTTSPFTPIGLAIKKS